MRRWLLPLLLLGLAAGPASALTITVIGQDGAAGVQGDYGLPGGPGGAGQDAVAVAESPDAENFALAQAGRGGEGGRGGLPFYNEIPPGPGGDAGSGGAASARAVSDAASAHADAHAIGGSGGFPGEGAHEWTTSGSAPDGAGNHGSPADAEADATSAAGSAEARAEANAGGSSGGRPGSGTGLGSDAHAVANAERTSSSGGRNPPQALATAVATGGGGGFLVGGDASNLDEVHGGDATSEAEGHGRGATLTAANAFATGGGGGRIDPEEGDSIGATGGDAHASASAEGEGTGAVYAYAQAIGGQGGASGHGVPGAPGTGTATAFGRSLGGGLVDVQTQLYGGPAGITYGGFGADAALTDSASGATSGLLRLNQTVWGGAGIGGGPGGRAESILHGVNPGGGALEVGASADAGADADAHASATGLGNGDESVTVRASALSRGAGVPTLGEVFGRSPGRGTVLVSGGVTSAGTPAPGPSPATPDLVLVNAVDGETRGALLLAQGATSFTGHAESRLVRTHSGSSLALSSYAEGRAPVAVVDGNNDAGAVHVIVRARGFEGGDARAEAHALSSADGAPVLVNVPLRWNGFDALGPFGAHAGGGLPGGATGSASSRSVGEHTGDGEVIVADEAYGASARGQSLDAGSAGSEARASNAGRSLVASLSTAFGGTAEGYFGDPAGRGGDAVAHARSSGGGSALAGARARAGIADALADSGLASALAEADAPKAQIGSEAITGEALTARVSAAARGEVRAHASVRSAETAAPNVDALDAYARGVHSLDALTLSAALAGNPNTAAAFASAQALVLGELGGGGHGASRLAFSGELDLGTALLGASAFEGLVIGFLDPTLTSTASLRLAIEVDGKAVYRAKLRGSDTAALDDRLVQLAMLPAGSLRIVLDMKTKDPASAAGLDFLVGGVGGATLAAVPEPRAWLAVLATGFAVAWGQRGASRASASGVVTGSEHVGAAADVGGGPAARPGRAPGEPARRRRRPARRARRRDEHRVLGREHAARARGERAGARDRRRRPPRRAQRDAALGEQRGARAASGTRAGARSSAKACVRSTRSRDATQVARGRRAPPRAARPSTARPVECGVAPSWSERGRCARRSPSDGVRNRSPSSGSKKRACDLARRRASARARKRSPAPARCRSRSAASSAAWSSRKAGTLCAALGEPAPAAARPRREPLARRSPPRPSASASSAGVAEQRCPRGEARDRERVPARARACVSVRGRDALRARGEQLGALARRSRCARPRARSHSTFVPCSKLPSVGDARRRAQNVGAALAAEHRVAPRPASRRRSGPPRPRCRRPGSRRSRRPGRVISRRSHAAVSRIGQTRSSSLAPAAPPHLGVDAQQLALVVEHLLEVRHAPVAVHAVAVEAAAELVVEAARAISRQREARGTRAPRAPRASGSTSHAASSSVEVRRGRELGRRRRSRRARGRRARSRRSAPRPATVPAPGGAVATPRRPLATAPRGSAGAVSSTCARAARCHVRSIAAQHAGGTRAARGAARAGSRCRRRRAGRRACRTP